MSDLPLVLGVETSCDETGIGLVRGDQLIAHRLASSVDLHAEFGGVVPEVASRAHLEAMVPLLAATCTDAGITPAAIDGVAVTSGPGLVGALLVGVASAKALSVGLGRPLYGVNHLAAHVAVDQLEHGELPRPLVALLVSGGHTSLLLVDNVATHIESLGGTLDDAAGEAFDKVARILDLPFPGGPHIDRLAAEGKIDSEFPRPLLGHPEHKYNFSFSGLKTAVVREHTRQQLAGRVDTANFAASFQEAVVDVLISKALAACAEYSVGHLLIGGGVAANSRLRAVATERCAEAGVTLRIPRPELCTDNGAMVASLGSLAMQAGVGASDIRLGANSTWSVTEIVSP